MNKVKNMEKTNTKEAEDYMNDLVLGPHLMMKYMKSINLKDKNYLPYPINPTINI